MIQVLTLFITITVELVFLIIVIKWYRRRHKPVGDIIVTERPDGIPILTFDFDNYGHPKETVIGRKKVIFRVVRASYTPPVVENVEDSS